MNPGVIGAFIPIIIFMIPIVAILTGHQRKMMELMHQNPTDPGAQNEVANLRQDVARLHEAVATLAINVDNLKDEIRGNSGFEERLKLGE